jgi:hypothetical protein
MFNIFKAGLGSVCARFSCAVAICLLVAGAARAQSLTVYDDAMQNTFDGPGYSYGADPTDWDFANTTPVHTGANSIRFIGHDFNALAFYHVGGSLSTAQYSTIHFWIHGGTTGGQHLQLNVQNGMTSLANAPLDSYIAGGSIAANTWREVTIDLTQPPLSINGNFDRFDLQNQISGIQPRLYVDDITLVPPVAQAANAMVIEHDYVFPEFAGSIVSDRFTWQDSAGHPRVATLAHNDVSYPVGVYGGAMREFRYQLPNGTQRVAGPTSYGNGGYAGFGYVVAHSAAGNCGGRDDSPLGHQFPGTWTRVFEGRHHAIFRFNQDYVRNCPGVSRTIPVVMDWMFSTGRDNPVYAVTWNVDQLSPSAPADTLYDDSRAPYGELNIDGDGSAAIDGTAWGDRWKFTTTSAPVRVDSSWTWNVPNTVPYVKEWIAGPLDGSNHRDATMGLVQTQTMTQQDAAGGRDPNYHDNTVYWNKTSADGNACPDGVYSMPCVGEWPYQANAFNFGLPPNSSNNARLTWRTQWGFLGQTSYVVHDNVVMDPPGLPGYPKKSYSTYVVLGTHGSGPVEAQVTQVETIQTLNLTTMIGGVVTSGPAGVTRTDTPVTYAPAGYNHVYGALAFSANANQLDANIAVGAGTLAKPLIIVSSYTGGYPQTVRFGGTPLTQDVDFFPSLRASASELWITLNRNVSGATNRLEISAGGGGGAPSNLVATATSTSQASLTWTGVGGAVNYEIWRGTTINNVAMLTTSTTAAFDDSPLAANTTYIYKVRANLGGGPTAFSNVDVATTIVFTDDPLYAGTFVKAVHVTQLRTAVNAMRVAGALGAYGFSDAGLAAGTSIKASHINELRLALDQARSAIGLSALGYTDLTITVGVTTVKLAHVKDLRDGVK